MSTGGNRSPYRPPCGYDAEEPELYWLGSPWQHYVSGEAAIPRYANLTMVPDYRDPSCDGYEAGGIAPYSRPNPAHIGCQGAGGDGDICDLECGPWPDPPFDGYTDNSYEAYDSAETLDIATCRKIGYKILFARKAWHGRYGFNTNNDLCTSLSANGDGPCTSHPENDSPPTTKYRTLSWSITATFFNNIGTGSQTDTYTMSGSCTVDRLTGVKTYSDLIATARFQIISGITTDCTYDLCNGENNCGDPVGVTSTFTDALIGAVNSFCQSSASATYENGDGTQPNDSIAGPVYPGLGGTLAFDVSETSYSRTWTGNVAPDISMDFVNYSISATLSDPYTSDDVNDDIDTLLAEWNLGDDSQYPWRTDGNCTRGPYMSYLECGPNAPTAQYCSTPDNCSTAVATTLAAYGVGSKILGSPTPAGYEPYFDFRFQIWNIYSDEGCEGCWDIFQYGDYAPSWAVNATQWTNLQDASALLPCAFRAYNNLQTGLTCCNQPATYLQGYLIGSKYAEVVLLGAPSHNFARPCGPKDAETIDQNSISCSDGTGALRWMDISNPCPIPPATNGAWNDNSPKGDFCLLAWTFNYRALGENLRLRTVPDDPFTGLPVCEYQPNPDILPVFNPVTGAWNGITCSQQCATFVPCCPAVVYLSNNTSDTSANSQRFAIPKLGCDDTYGSKWQQAIQQWMVDPLWQPPALPCDLEDGIAWTEDDGSGQCSSDGHQYYPQRPWEEARCSLPDGAPDLPDGCYIGVLDVESINAGATDGNIIYYPGPGTCWMPWWTWALNRANTVATGGGGCFQCDYADPMTICEDDVEIEPP